MSVPRLDLLGSSRPRSQRQSFENMVYLIGIAVLLLAVAFGLRPLLLTAPRVLARVLRTAATALALAVAVGLVGRGQPILAFLWLAVCLSLLMVSGMRTQSTHKAPGQSSQVETGLLRVRLDHDSGAMSGEVLSGPSAGRSLASLSRDDLVALLVHCRGSDPQSEALLEAFLDRAHPGWRDPGEAAGSSLSGTLSADEARKILGVGSAASEDEIRNAWRELMKRNHPDQGGSPYLAAKINEARDVLLGGKG